MKKGCMTGLVLVVVLAAILAFAWPQLSQGVLKVLYPQRYTDLVEQEARNEGLSKIRLTVNRHNTHAAQVYEHYGYETVEEAAADIGCGYVMDDYIMVKRV